jgi:TfoX/Sxy family transcriptional regulator of competence genes
MIADGVVADELFASVAEAFRGQPAVTQSKMFGAPGLKVGGKVFACLVKGKLVVKLRRERVEALLESGYAERFDPGMGRVMKEWVAVEPRTADEWLGLAAEAREFVAAGR